MTAAKIQQGKPVARAVLAHHMAYRFIISDSSSASSARARSFSASSAASVRVETINFCVNRGNHVQAHPDITPYTTCTLQTNKPCVPDLHSCIETLVGCAGTGQRVREIGVPHYFNTSPVHHRCKTNVSN